MGLALAFKAFWKALKNPDLPKIESSVDHSHLRLLALLQNSSRLIDFLKEDISQYEDAQIGSAVRKIHQECSKSLEELITIRPVLEEQEGDKVHVPHGYDPSAIKIVGKIKGNPPYNGILVHKGWKAHKHSLPRNVGEPTMEILSPAEIEVR